MTAHPYINTLKAIPTAFYTGYVNKISPGFVESNGPLCTVGDICEIECQQGSDNIISSKTVRAEVASIREGCTVLIPLDKTASIFPNAKVTALRMQNRAPVGDVFEGRLIDALAQPLDGSAQIISEDALPIAGTVLLPMEREEPNAILQTGIRAIDGLLTIGRGQRLGIFAASGVGKTTLLKQLSTQIECDRCVICLVGERGREVEAIWSELSKLDDISKYCCVAATSDKSAALRTRAVYQAVSLAEYWRSKGEHVLLMVDSVTRFAMALREIGLAAGAPPTQRAYTPNVFEALPRLVERCGGAKSGGSITAIMTVLSETDDVDDPIVEVMKSLLDGHIVLSRQLAELGHFPAIDITKSVSRQANRLMQASHAKSARRATASLSTYEEARVMIESGIYKDGSNPKIDEAIKNKDALAKFLQQREQENSKLDKTLNALKLVAGRGESHA